MKRVKVTRKLWRFRRAARNLSLFHPLPRLSFLRAYCVKRPHSRLHRIDADLTVCVQ